MIAKNKKNLIILGIVLVLGACAKFGAALDGLSALSVANNEAICNSQTTAGTRYYSTPGTCQADWGSASNACVLTSVNATTVCYVHSISGGASTGGTYNGVNLVSTPAEFNFNQFNAYNRQSVTVKLTNTGAVSASSCSFSMSEPNSFSVTPMSATSIPAQGFVLLQIGAFWNASTPANTGYLQVTCGFGADLYQYDSSSPGFHFDQSANVSAGSTGGGSTGSNTNTSTSSTSSTTTSASSTNSTSSTTSSTSSTSGTPVLPPVLSFTPNSLSTTRANFPIAITLKNAGPTAATSCNLTLTNGVNSTSGVTNFQIFGVSSGFTIPGNGGTKVIDLDVGLPTTSLTTKINLSCSYSGGSGPISITSGQYLKQFESTCFTADTLIEMADGSRKPISEVKEGDRLRSANGASNLVLKAAIYPHSGLKYSLNHGAHFVTESHPFLTTEGWRSINPALTEEEVPGFHAGKLMIGNVLLTRDGPVRLDSIESKSTPDQVYSISTDGDHTYLANGFIVHNNKLPAPK